MSEIKKEVKTYRIEYSCDSCNIGKMLLLPMSIENKILGNHKCNNCNEEKVLNRIYPYIVYEEIP